MMITRAYSCKVKARQGQNIRRYDCLIRHGDHQERQIFWVLLSSWHNRPSKKVGDVSCFAICTHGKKFERKQSDQDLTKKDPIVRLSSLIENRQKH